MGGLKSGHFNVIMHSGFKLLKRSVFNIERILTCKKLQFPLLQLFADQPWLSTELDK